MAHQLVPVVQVRIGTVESDSASRLGDLQRAAQSTDMHSLLGQQCGSSFSESFDAFVSSCIASGEQILHPRFGPRIREYLECSGVRTQDIDDYCATRFNDKKSASALMINALACVFQLDVGLSRVPRQVQQVCKDLEFDKDGLLIGPTKGIRYEKDGVLYSSNQLIPYNEWISQRYDLGKSTGFLDTLLRQTGKNPELDLRLRVSTDLIVDPTVFGMYMTKAYTYGPKGISVDKLRSPDFPQNSAGTVTKHLQEDPESLCNMLFPVSAFEVMWSAKDGLKTVQMEEVVVPDNRQAHLGSRIHNRYIHAIWDPKEECFNHFDGALRIYREDDYAVRLGQDIKASGKAGDYAKLFRVDGPISFELWADLTVKWFEGNVLASEYLKANFPA